MAKKHKSAFEQKKRLTISISIPMFRFVEMHANRNKITKSEYIDRLLVECHTQEGKKPKFTEDKLDIIIGKINKLFKVMRIN